MINPYKSLPKRLSHCLLTKDGLVIGGNGITMFRSNINGHDFFMVENLNSKKIFRDENKAINEFIVASGVHDPSNALKSPTEGNQESALDHQSHAGTGMGSADDDHIVGFGKKKKKKKKEKKPEAELTPFSTIDSDTVDRTSLEQAMNRKDLTVTQTARLADVHPSMISRLLREPSSTSGDKDPGGRNPGIELAAKLSEIFGIPIEKAFPDLFQVKKKKKKRKGNRQSGKSRKLMESIDNLIEDIETREDAVCEGLCNIIGHRPDLFEHMIKALTPLSPEATASVCRASILNHVNRNAGDIRKHSAVDLIENLNIKLHSFLQDNLLNFINILKGSEVQAKENIIEHLSRGYDVLSEQEMPTSTVGSTAATETSSLGAEKAAEDMTKADNSASDMVKEIEKMDEERQEVFNKQMLQQKKALTDTKGLVGQTSDTIADLVANTIEDTDLVAGNLEKVEDELAQNIDEIGKTRELAMPAEKVPTI